jgi:hypothetical protein
MLSRQHLIHLAHLGADVRRPLFAARPLHGPTVGAIDFFGIPPAVKVFFGLLVARLVGRRRKSPRCHVAVSVFTPSGMPAVKICWQQLPVSELRKQFTFRVVSKPSRGGGRITAVQTFGPLPIR